jgi:hypothetical protein
VGQRAAIELLKMHGLEKPADEAAGEARKTIEAVAESVRKRSPLLLARWERAERERLAAEEPAAKDS